MASSPEKSYSYVKRFRENKKERSIEYLGGKCCVCDYDRCYQALQCHHVDPSSKDFNIAHKHGWSFERIKSELDKCILVCATCHAEIHAGTVLVVVEGIAPT